MNELVKPLFGRSFFLYFAIRSEKNDVALLLVNLILTIALVRRIGRVRELSWERR